MFPNLLKHCELCSMNLKCYAEYTKNMIKEVLSLENILNESHIRIREEARDWEGAIRRAGEVLVQAGSIKPGYIDKMIRQRTWPLYRDYARICTGTCSSL